MNFVIFPTFLLSTALYPLWKMAESSELLHDICRVNPLTRAVELIRFALYGSFNGIALMRICVAAVVSFGLSDREYDPARGLTWRKT